MQKITTCLWFDDNAEEAVDFYVSAFPNSEIMDVARYTEEASKAAGQPAGSVMTIAFELEGREFVALNGGPQFTFSPAISLVANCTTQDEVDRLWETLSRGGGTHQCGWLHDRFGVSWQIVPVRLIELLRHQDPAKARRVMQAMLQMGKLDIARLEQAAALE